LVCESCLELGSRNVLAGRFERVLARKTLLARLVTGLRLADSFRALVRRFPLTDLAKGESDE
jgi:hypothetical protein